VAFFVVGNCRLRAGEDIGQFVSTMRAFLFSRRA